LDPLGAAQEQNDFARVVGLLQVSDSSRGRT
jgi:hypothetical protein